MHRRGLNVRKRLLRIVVPALRAMGPAPAARIVSRIGRIEYDLLPRLRLRFDEAVRRGAAHFGAHWDIPAIGRNLAGNQIRWRTRDLLLDGVSDDHLAPLFDVVGRDQLEAALAERRGLVLLGNHFGAHMMPAHWIKRQGLPLRLFMERPHQVSRFLQAGFDDDGPLGQRKLFVSRKADTAEAAASILRATKVLKAGMVLYIAGDVRWSGQYSVATQFLGRSVQISATWAVLSALAGSPVVPVFCHMRDDGTHRLEFLPAFHVDPDQTKGPALEAHVRRFLEEIEARVAADPANSNDYFFWSEPDDPAVVLGRLGRRPVATQGVSR
ncbi:MAG: hypothetical protein KatS3mg108_1641 [Isosphaeraceae bacterium]|jgi:KDO2-lipid IV(A) lauroyltransferase|nr:MAG: hypothetical protein KatS3mg108_1641 [Isosphaeraceae bacterium]